MKLKIIVLACKGINGGNYVFLYLPNSKVEVDIPVYFQAPFKPQKDEGVIPDFTVKPVAGNIGNGLDTEILFVKKLIKN